MSIVPQSTSTPANAVSFKRDGVETARQSISPLHAINSAWRHRELITQLARRDVLSRYRGSFGGVIWSFLQPLIMLAIYTLALGVFLKAGGLGARSPLEYALILFAGLIVFNFFAECLGKAPSIVLINPNYVRRIVFPLEVLPWITVASALFHTALSLIAWLVFCLIVEHSIHWTIIFVPLLLAPLAIIGLGLCWLLGSLGVYIRDIVQLTAPLTQAMMFLSPLFYSIKDVPPAFRLVLLANPLSFIIEQARAVMVRGELPSVGLIVYYLAAGVFAWVSFCIFQTTRDGFADVI